MPELFSTHQVAKKLGVGMATLTRHIQAGKIPAPETRKVGGMRIRLWSEEDVERVRALLPKIANGRKTRYQRQKPEVRSQKSAKTRKQKPQPKRKRK